MEEKDFSFKLIFPLQCHESQLVLLNEKQERKLYPKKSKLNVTKPYIPVKPKLASLHSPRVKVLSQGAHSSCWRGRKQVDAIALCYYSHL